MSTNLQSVVAPEMILRDAIKSDLQTFVDNPALVDELFLDGYGEAVTTEIKSYLSARTVDGKFPFSLSVNWPKKGISLPHIGIILGQDQEVAELDMLANFAEVADNDDECTTDKAILTTGSDQTYNIMILSQHPNLTLYLYILIKALIILRSQDFTDRGMLNIILGGQDIQLDESQYPENTYARLLTLKCQVYFRVPDTAVNTIVQSISGTQTITEC